MGKLRNSAEAAFSNRNTDEALKLWVTVKVEPNNYSNFTSGFVSI